jgi:hypothetical protein
MFERFRKSDRAREKGRTAVQDRDDDAATTVHEREVERSTTVQERDRAPVTTLPGRDDTTATTTLRERDHAVPTSARDRDDASATTVAPPATTARDREDRAALRDRFDRDYVAEPRTLAPVVGDETLVAMHDRQRIRFGGISWGSAFFGLLSAIGLAALLLGIVAAAGVAIGVSEIKDVTHGNADTIGLGGAILVLAILALSWFCGGYVAGRMARFDGIRQGMAVWVWTVVIGVALAIAAVIGGSDYDVFAQLNLPNVAVGDQTLTTGGAITLAAACVVTLVFAVLGGKVGDRFHRRVDRFAAREYVEAP